MSRQSVRGWWCGCGYGSAVGVIYTLWVVVLVIQYPGRVAGFKFQTGTCPAFPIVSNFNYDQFSGLWNVIQMSNTAAGCYTLTFGAGAQGSDYTIDFRKQIWGLTAAGIFNMVTFTAYGYKQGNNPAQMLVSLPTTAFGVVSLQVVDTDYQNWALIWACKPSMFGHLEASIIVSRTTSIDIKVLGDLRVLIDKAGGSTDDLSTIQHGNCISTQGGRKFTIEFDPSLDKPLVNFDTYSDVGSNDVFTAGNDGGSTAGGGGAPTSGGGGAPTSGVTDYVTSGLNPCVVETDQYAYYYEDCPSDAIDPIYGTYDEIIGGGDTGTSGDTGGSGSGSGSETSKFENRPCIYLSYDSEYLVGDPCPQNYYDYAFLPEEFYADTDFAGQACYNFVNGAAEYYSECPADAQAAIPVDFYNYLDTTSNTDSYYTDTYNTDSNSIGGSDPKFDNRGCLVKEAGYYYAYPDDCPDDADFAILPEEFYSDYDLTGTPCYNYANGKPTFYDSCPSDAEAAIPADFYDSNTRVLNGKRRIPMPNGKDNGLKKKMGQKGKNGRNKKGKGKIKKLMELNGQQMLEMIKNSKTLQRLLEMGNIDWKNLREDMTMSKLKKLVNNEGLWSKIREAFREGARRSKGRSNQIEKPQGEELWKMIFSNEEIQKLLQEAGVVLRGPAADLKFDDLKKIINNDEIWKKIRSILLQNSAKKSKGLSKTKSEKDPKKKSKDKSKKKKKGPGGYKTKKTKNKKRTSKTKDLKTKEGKRKRERIKKSLKEVLKGNPELMKLLTAENIAIDSLPDDIKLNDLKKMIQTPGVFETIKDGVKRKQKKKLNGSKDDDGKKGKKTKGQKSKQRKKGDRKKKARKLGQKTSAGIKKERERSKKEKAEIPGMREKEKTKERIMKKRKNDGTNAKRQSLTKRKKGDNQKQTRKDGQGTIVKKRKNVEERITKKRKNGGTNAKRQSSKKMKKGDNQKQIRKDGQATRVKERKTFEGDKQNNHKDTTRERKKRRKSKPHDQENKKEVNKYPGADKTKQAIIVNNNSNAKEREKKTEHTNNVKKNAIIEDEKSKSEKDRKKKHKDEQSKKKNDDNGKKSKDEKKEGKSENDKTKKNKEK